MLKVPIGDPHDPFAGCHPESERNMEDVMSGEVVAVEPGKVPDQSAPITPMALVEMAVQKGADIDQLTKLMDLNDRWQANQARQAFNTAKAAFQSDAPTIGKTRKGHNTMYAGLAETLEQVRGLMAKHNLSHSWATQQDGTTITVTCTLTHTGGHQEATSLSAAPDTSGNKNAIQAVGSTVSYLQRYTLFAVLGLASREQDDDGAAATEFINAAQKNALVEELKASGADTTAFLKLMNVETLDQLPASQYSLACVALKHKREAAARESS